MRTLVCAGEGISLKRCRFSALVFVVKLVNVARETMMLPTVLQTTEARKLGARAAAVVAKLRELAPYAAIELVLPGGSLMALLLWLYRRQRNVAAFATQGMRTSRSSQLAAAIVAVMMVGATAIMASVPRVAMVAPMAATGVDHGRRGIVTRRLVDHGRGCSPGKRIEVDVQMDAGVGGACG
jgi:hypothetical protein